MFSPFRYAFLLIGLAVLSGRSYAAPQNRKKLPDIKISISFYNDRLDSSISRIHAGSGIDFAYNPEELKDYHVGIVSFQKTAVSVILNQLLQNTGLRYTEVGSLVVVKRENIPDVSATSSGDPLTAPAVPVAGSGPVQADKAPGVSFTLATIPTPARRLVDITGTVVDSSGKPLEGVNVIIKGTGQGTTTDVNGIFHINGPSSDVTLLFSFTGYAATEQKASKGAMRIVLLTKVNALDDVVVIGYGTQKRSDVTGSITSVTGNDIKNLPATSVEEALQGRMAGVQVTKGGGAPGSSADILIRGISSLNQPNPLYIVDGVRSSGDNFNIQDIASIDVLKDASAAAIYGSAAAGGVILITTKKGASGKPTIRFNARYGDVQPQLLHLLDRDDWVRLQRIYNPTYLQGIDAATLPNTDWTKALYGSGTDQNYDLSISGGTPSSHYLVSGFYNAQKGVFIDNSTYLSGVRINSDYKLSNAIKVGEQLTTTLQNINPTSVASPPNPIFRSVPIMPVYDSAGNFAKTPAGFQGGNPVGGELTNKVQNRTASLQGNAFAEIALPFYLSLRSTVSISMGSASVDNFHESYDFGSISQIANTLEKSSSWYQTVLDNFTLTFDHAFGKHSITALAGYEQITSKSDGTDVTENNQSVQPNFSFFRSSGTSITVNDGGNVYDPNSLIKSQFGRINYNYAGKYFVSGAIRRDGDFTHFGPGNQYGVFPSVSGGWRISEEPFFHKAAPIFDQFKLRASYGVLGNSNIPTYYFLNNYQTLNAQNFSDQGTHYLGLGFNQIANTDIRWESLYESNFGIDASLLDNHLTVTAEYYDKTTKNVLYTVPVPPSSGIINSYQTNVGSISNKGFEFSIGYKNKIGDLGYSVSANGAFNKNKVIELSATNSSPILDGNSNLNGGYSPQSGYSLSITQPGHPFAQFYGFRATGIYQNAQQIAAHPQFAGQTADVGDLIFEDVNHSGTLSDSDRTVIGNPNPKLVYGFNFQFTYKGFDASLLFSGVAGVQILNETKPNAQYLFSDGNTTSAIFGDSFLGGNGLTSQPRTGKFVTSGNSTTFITDPNGNYTRPNSYFVEPGGYLKLKNLQVGYTFSLKALQAAHISALRIYGMVNNVFTITKYSGLDPELSGTVTARGIDYPNQYPHTRIYAGGITLSF